MNCYDGTCAPKSKACLIGKQTMILNINVQQMLVNYVYGHDRPNMGTPPFLKISARCIVTPELVLVWR